jgi:hypothetical protein
VSFPPRLLDELARVFACAAVEAFLAATVTATAEEGVAKSGNDSSDSTPIDLDPRIATRLTLLYLENQVPKPLKEFSTNYHIPRSRSA